jgi:hypothetical protein
MAQSLKTIPKTGFRREYDVPLAGVVAATKSVWHWNSVSN